MKLRIVRFKVVDGIFENIVTSLSEDVFSAEERRKIYHLRWNIELSFKDLKHTIGTTNFHSKKSGHSPIHQGSADPDCSARCAAALKCRFSRGLR